MCVMCSLDVSRCAGDMCKPSVDTTDMCVYGIGQPNAFEAVASRGAGDLRFVGIWFKNEGEVFMS